ncbi:MAG: dihydrofolate reductase [Candidatus Paceibacterota bacterium]|jgi:dihydrofolate reductase
MISIICAIGKNNELGKGNALLWDLPLDMKHFRETTKGKTVIMGQKTFESIGRILPDRRNIILTKDENYKVEGAEVVFSMEEAFALIESSQEENFIIGGGQIYRLFFGKADRLYITHVDAEFTDADTYFPNIDMNEWKIVSEEDHQKDEKHKYDFVFRVYERIKNNNL